VNKAYISQVSWCFCGKRDVGRHVPTAKNKAALLWRTSNLKSF